MPPDLRSRHDYEEIKTPLVLPPSGDRTLGDLTLASDCRFHCHLLPDLHRGELAPRAWLLNSKVPLRWALLQQRLPLRWPAGRLFAGLPDERSALERKGSGGLAALRALPGEHSEQVRLAKERVPRCPFCIIIWPPCQAHLRDASGGPWRKDAAKAEGWQTELELTQERRKHGWEPGLGVILVQLVARMKAAGV